VSTGRHSPVMLMNRHSENSFCGGIHPWGTLKGKDMRSLSAGVDCLSQWENPPPRRESLRTQAYQERRTGNAESVSPPKKWRPGRASEADKRDPVGALKIGSLGKNGKLCRGSRITIQD